MCRDNRIIRLFINADANVQNDGKYIGGHYEK
jgi:hypothetical protein